jgi:hypothetical protein
MRRDLAGDRSALTHGNAGDDEIGALGRCGVAVKDLIGEPEFDDAPARRRGPRGGGDRAGKPLRPRGTRNR